MYLTIQKKVNRWMLLIFSVTFILLFLLYKLFKTFSLSSVILMLGCFIVFMFTFGSMRFLEKNLEYRALYKRLKAGDIALAKIKSATFLKDIYESDLKAKHVYKLDIELFDKEMKKTNFEIYEHLLATDFSCLPGYVYVSYNGKKDSIGILPTVLLSMTPAIEPIVRKYESKKNINYLAVYRKNGVLLQSMESAVKGENVKVINEDTVK